jgi:hypothetical protein
MCKITFFNTPGKINQALPGGIAKYFLEAAFVAR